MQTNADHDHRSHSTLIHPQSGIRRFAAFPISVHQCHSVVISGHSVVNPSVMQRNPNH